MRSLTRLIGAFFTAFSLSACITPQDPSSDANEPVQAYAALTNIPAGTACLRFTSTPVPADGRAYEQKVTVSPGTPATAAIRGLPFGVPLTIMAETFAQPCADVDKNSLATWLSDAPASVTLTYGQIVDNLAFRMRPTGGANTAIDFLFFNLAPVSQAFGTGIIGSPTQAVNQTFTLTNAGTSATGSVSATLTGSHASSFQIVTNGCAGALAAGASCTMQLRCVPVSRGALTASLQVTATPGGTTSAALTATGQKQATLTISPATREFGTVGINQVSPATSFTVTNTGDVASGIPSITLASTTPGETAVQFSLMSGHTCTAALAAGGTCTVQAMFTPRSGTPLGAKSASLTVAASPGGSAVATLTGTAAAAPAITLSHSSFTFPAPIGSTPPSQTITVRNTGGVPVGPMTVVPGGTHSNEFTIVSNGCGVSVAVGGTCTFSIQARPAQPGTRSGNVTVTALPGVTAQVSFSINSPALLVPSVTSINFGTVSGSGSPATRSISVTNRGVVPLPGLSFNSNPQFRVSGNGCASGLNPGASCNATVEFDPPTISFPSNTTYNFTMTGTANAGNSFSLQLTGVGSF